VLSYSIGGWGRCAALPLRGPRPATGQDLHGLLDTGDVPLDVLHVQASSDNLTVGGLEQCHPRISKACPSLRVPDQRHSIQVVSPSWTDRRISAWKPRPAGTRPSSSRHHADGTTGA
jgi:hypothetical protein